MELLIVDLDWHPFSLGRLWCGALNGGSGTVSGVAGEADSRVAVSSTLGADIVCQWSVSVASDLPSLSHCLRL